MDAYLGKTLILCNSLCSTADTFQHCSPVSAFLAVFLRISSSIFILAIKVLAFNLREFVRSSNRQ
jgi:hypothetical protein